MDELQVVLASASPRRLALLRRLGLEPKVIPADVDEVWRVGESAQALVGRRALSNAQAVDVDASALVIGADTVVVLDGEVLGKPVDEYDAVAMLRRLSGRTHAVMTGVAVRLGDATEWSVVRTEVMFRALGDGEIKRYVATGEPMDKAGSYAIQGGAGAFIPKITGSDTNVVGLPLHETVDLARKLGVDLLA